MSTAQLATTTTSGGGTNGNSTADATKKANAKARLQACVLSTYDLPIREPPLCVSVCVNNETVKSQPPAQRHKDRNSFKFHKNQELMLEKSTLPQLYSCPATITLEYANPQHNLQAKYDLSQLKINETVWLILQLEPVVQQKTKAEERNNDDKDGTGMEDVPPTLRLQMTLYGPYRSEIDVLVKVFKQWFGVVDQVDNVVQRQVISKNPVKNFDTRYLLIPLVPILAIIVAVSPIAIGLFTLTLPVALPVTVVIGIIMLFVGLGITGIYGSTKMGRTQIQNLVLPVWNTLLSTPVGQRTIYNTGDRPTPVNILKLIMPDGIWQRLIVSLVLDGIGSSSYLLPMVGESFDLAWAPIQTMFIMALYNEESPNLKYVSFAEELLPFTDVLPTATTGWFMEFGLPLILGASSSPSTSSSTALTTTTASSNNASTPKRSGTGNHRNNNAGDGISVRPQLSPAEQGRLAM